MLSARCSLGSHSYETWRAAERIGLSFNLCLAEAWMEAKLGNFTTFLFEQPTNNLSSRDK